MEAVLEDTGCSVDQLPRAQAFHVRHRGTKLGRCGLGYEQTLGSVSLCPASSLVASEAPSKAHQFRQRRARLHLDSIGMLPAQLLADLSSLDRLQVDPSAKVQALTLGQSQKVVCPKP